MVSSLGGITPHTTNSKFAVSFLICVDHNKSRRGRPRLLVYQRLQDAIVDLRDRTHPMSITPPVRRVPTESCGKVTIYSLVASDIVVDVSGYFSAAGGSGTQFSAESDPVRICDTRSGNPSLLSGSAAQCNGADSGGDPIGSGTTLTIQVTGLGGVPSSAEAEVVNLTAVDPSANTYLTVFPTMPVPFVSDLNPAAGAVRANMAVATLSSTGTVSIYNDTGSTNVVVDLLGWYS
jgi:hypothetical protein